MPFGMEKLESCSYPMVKTCRCHVIRFDMMNESETHRPRLCIASQKMCRDDHDTETTLNKCIGEDTKAAARQSPNCIKKNKKR